MSLEDAASRIQQLLGDRRRCEQEDDVEVAHVASPDVQYNQQRQRMCDAIVAEDFELASEAEYDSALIQ